MLHKWCTSLRLLSRCSAQSHFSDTSFSSLLCAYCSQAQQPALSLSHDIDPATNQPSGVAIVQLKRKATLNSLTPAVGAELQALVDPLINDTRVRALVITGSGPAFSAGGDYDWLSQRARDSQLNNREIMQEFYNQYMVLRRMPFPVVAAINGHAIGAGLCLALASDVRYAQQNAHNVCWHAIVAIDHRIVAAKAKLGLNFLRLGMSPGFGATQLLPALVGLEHAARLLLTGDLILGDEAVRIGLASECHANAEDVLSAALALARRMATVSPTCMRATVEMLRERAEQPGQKLRDVLAEEAYSQAASMCRADFREGLKAARSKVEPVFADRERGGVLAP